MNKNNKANINNMIHVSMLTALLSILSQFRLELPGGIPITLQTFCIFLIGSMLGPISGLFTVITYLLMGVIGIPVFSNFNSGISALVGPTGGFLIGFLPMVFIVGFGKNKKFIVQFFFNVIGLISCYIIGIIMYRIVSNVWILPSIPFMFLKDSFISVISILFSKELVKRIDINSNS